MKKIKIFTTGLIAGLLLTSTVFASSYNIQAVFADLKLLINGEFKQLESKPILYNGTSYLPVREISNLLGYDVTYKADTKTVVLNNSQEKITKMTTSEKIEDITYKIGDKISMGDFEVKVSSIEYLTKVDSFLANPDEIFAIANLEVFTTLEPQNSFYWTSGHLVSSFNVDGKSLTMMHSTGERAKIYPNRHNESMIFTSISSSQKIASITLFNPITRQSVDVILN